MSDKPVDKVIDTPSPSPPSIIRVVVIDDSAYNRQTISAMIESQPGMRVVGRAGDGEEGLKLVFQHEPHIITLDLEMPRMDGFTFLRILMARRPTPVIVISGLGSKENVFKALELGALDFVVKPSRQISPELHSIRDDLAHKIRLVTQLKQVHVAERMSYRAATQRTPSAQIPAVPAVAALDVPRDAATQQTTSQGAPVGPAPPRLVALAASTGGPPAILQLLSAMAPTAQAGFVVTQHMPPRFTRAFAERLDRLTKLTVREAQEGDCVTTGVVLVAPGDGSLVLRREAGELRVHIEPDDHAAYIPSADRMFESAAEAMRGAVLGVILTGMAGDGARGVRAIKAAGGRILSEDPATAVVPGMPTSAIATGVVDEILDLSAVPEAIERFLRT